LQYLSLDLVSLWNWRVSACLITSGPARR